MDYAKEAEIVRLLDHIEDVLEEGKTSFIDKTKVSIDRDEIMDIINDIRLKLPTELQQAVWIVEERNKILAEAQSDAGLVVQEAQDTLHKMIDQHEVTRFAEERAQYILENARESSREIHNGAVAYAADKFLEVEHDLNHRLDVMDKELKQTVEYLNKQLETTVAAMNREVKYTLDKMIEEMRAFDHATKEVLAEIYDNRQELEQSIQHAPLRKEG